MLVENPNPMGAVMDSGLKASELIETGRSDVRHADTSSHAIFPTEPQRLPCEADSAILSEPAERMAQPMGEKETGWAPTLEKKAPLQLLDLPVDVLKEIIKEITHTNDLTSLALTHSALNDLAIPYIYSRFDIVWPETQITTEPRTGVDALTYGLSTLVLSEGAFANATTPVCGHHSYCTHCGKSNHIEVGVETKSTALRSHRRINNFAQYTRKFSLGNGPPEWVHEYLISKESGKMLGTLVALAVARMPNLETFVWDMPTGILRDVWSALASSGDCRDCKGPRLERIWIRWHDNRNTPTPIDGQITGSLLPSLSAAQGISAGLPPNATLTDGVWKDILARSYRTVEHPNLSILPSLKSITVLDIDEPAYLDELSVLIDRSVECLRDLRLGLASWFNEKNLSPTDIGTSAVSHAEVAMDYATSGGLFGMVMSKIYDCRSLDPRENSGARKDCTKQAEAELVADSPLVNLSTSAQQMTTDEISSHIGQSFFGVPGFSNSATMPQQDLHILKSFEFSQSLVEDEDVESPASPPTTTIRPSSISVPVTSRETFASSLPIRISTSSKPCVENPAMIKSEASSPSRLMPEPKILKLETLELEKISMCVPVMQKTIDWTVLTTLTLLNCQSDEALWKALRKKYAPRTTGMPTLCSQSISELQSSRDEARKTTSISSSDYALRLKRIHSNNVSTSLITFLKEALAPNTLEWMFLQEGGRSPSKVTVDAIYKGPLRRHRESLKKVMIDSGDRRSGRIPRNSKWKKWMLNPEILSFITSGKMSCLRELAITLEHKHWHFFLQRLPQISHLRSLFIPYMADHIHGHELDPRELALQVVDIVALRPEIELCYLGIAMKCFEILESKQSDDPQFVYGDSSSAAANNGPGGVVMGNPDEDSETDDDDADEQDNDGGGNQNDSAFLNPDGNDSDNSDGSEAESDDDGEVSEDNMRQLKLREILFYDDKVSIFKARHAQL